MLAASEAPPVPRDVAEALPPSLAGLPEFVEICRAVFRESPATAPGPGRGRASSSLDVAIERRLISELERLFARPTIRAEETFRQQGRDLNPGRGLRVHLDPLDGSEALAAHRDTYSMSAAFEIAGRIEAGLVYRPSTDTVYLAGRGLGAYANGVRFRCGGSRQPVIAIKSTLQREPRVAEFCHRARGQGYTVERLSSIALRLCGTATGAISGTMKRINRRRGVACLWGIAGGALICEEAGAVVRDLDHRPFDPRSEGVMAMNPRDADRLLSLLDRAG